MTAWFGKGKQQKKYRARISQISDNQDDRLDTRKNKGRYPLKYIYHGEFTAGPFKTPAKEAVQKSVRAPAKEPQKWKFDDFNEVDDVDDKIQVQKVRQETKK